MRKLSYIKFLRETYSNTKDSETLMTILDMYNQKLIGIKQESSKGGKRNV